MSTQLAFEPILSQAHKSRWAAAHAYAKRHRSTYVHFASELAPNLDDWTHVWDRAAFAILSANTSVHNAGSALRTLRLNRGCFPPTYRLAGITPERIIYVNALPTREWVATLMKGHESWHQYRLRLARDVDGLGLTKASFAAALLCPLKSRVACLDVWMLRWFGLPDETTLTPAHYRRLERELRRFGAQHHVCGSLAQWMIWDLIRTGTPTALHPIFQR